MSEYRTPDGCKSDPGDGPAPDFQTDIACAVHDGTLAAQREDFGIWFEDVDVSVEQTGDNRSNANDVTLQLTVRVRTFASSPQDAALEVFGELAAHFARAR